MDTSQILTECVVYINKRNNEKSASNKTYMLRYQYIVESNFNRAARWQPTREEGRKRKNDHNALLGYMLVPGLGQIRTVIFLNRWLSSVASD